MLQLRQDVFVVEQACIYNDIDEKDKRATHVVGWDDSQKTLCACLRIMYSQENTPTISIGRVVVAKVYRREGVGKKLMQIALENIRQVAAQSLIAPPVITISAQQQLTKFYTSMGFVIDSPPYDEDGILHVRMVLNHQVHFQ
ncbi:MAG: ElaA protein [Granulosicoccus sp.]|jgi:ElaA protein